MSAMPERTRPVEPSGAGDDRAQLDELRSKRLAVLEKLAELRAANGDAREVRMIAVERAWAEFESTFRSVTAT